MALPPDSPPYMGIIPTDSTPSPDPPVRLNRYYLGGRPTPPPRDIGMKLVLSPLGTTCDLQVNGKTIFRFYADGSILAFKSDLDGALRTTSDGTLYVRFINGSAS
jgi:hypothetical protein